MKHRIKGKKSNLKPNVTLLNTAVSEQGTYTSVRVEGSTGKKEKIATFHDLM